MNSLGSNSPFSPHHDVLSATPTTPTEKTSLLSELKSRGRSSVSSKRYPDAKDLYSKAIEIATSTSNDDDNSSDGRDVAILYSNRALCHLQMNDPSESYGDATSATCYDPSYLKGFWRLGQACVAVYDKETLPRLQSVEPVLEEDGGKRGEEQERNLFEKLNEALEAYGNALGLEPENKALKKEVEKVEKKLVREKENWEKRKVEFLENKDANKSNVVKTEVIKKTIVETESSSSTTEEKKTETTTSSSKPTTDESGEFTKSDHVRGYKIIDGKKTSFFHHEQTEEEKRLIGDIAPKRIDPNSTTAETSPQTKEGENDTDRSAWNKAGTWEERDLTPWAIETLRETLLSKGTYTLPSTSPDPDAVVRVMEITELKSSREGGNAHASVATVRGKKRYIFEFTVCVHWTMTFGNGVDSCKGSMTFDDVDGTHEMGEGYDVSEFKVEGDAPGDAKFLLERFVRNGGLRGVVEKALDDWIVLFRETY